MSPVFTCFFTADYARHARGLRESLDRFGLAHHLQVVTSRGTWQKNCQRKPAWIRSMLMQHHGPVCWIDADARIRQRPDVLLELAATRHADVAVHDYGLSGHRSEILSGTVYVDHTGPAHDLLDRWQSHCVRRPEAFDQRCLQHALEETPDLRVAELPPEYCFIFDIFREEFYRRNHPEIGEPVIEHLQASREVRRREREASA